MPKVTKEKLIIEDASLKIKCTRCLNRIKLGSEKVNMILIEDDSEVIHGSLPLCDSCFLAMPIGVRNGRPDMILEWVSNDLIQPLIKARYNMNTWDVCQKLEFRLGSTQYCKEISHIATQKDPGAALIELWESMPRG